MGGGGDALPLPEGKRPRDLGFSHPCQESREVRLSLRRAAGLLGSLGRLAAQPHKDWGLDEDGGKLLFLLRAKPNPGQD